MLSWPGPGASPNAAFAALSARVSGAADEASELNEIEKFIASCDDENLTAALDRRCRALEGADIRTSQAPGRTRNFYNRPIWPCKPPGQLGLGMGVSEIPGAGPRCARPEGGVAGNPAPGPCTLKTMLLH